MDKVETLQQAIIYFNDYQNCHDLMVMLRWPDGKVTCPRCGAEKVTYLAKARVWKCYGKHKSPTFTLKTGTIFEDSPISLDKWLVALWLVVNCKNGISSMEIHRDLGVTQKTAWFMAHRLRLALQEGGFILSGEVEVDETFIGGKARNMHVATKKRRITGTGGKDKTVVFGMVERGGKVKARVVSSRKRSNGKAKRKSKAKPKKAAQKAKSVGTTKRSALKTQTASDAQTQRPDSKAEQQPTAQSAPVKDVVREILADGELHTGKSIAEEVQARLGSKIKAFTVYGVLSRKGFEKVGEQFRLEK